MEGNILDTIPITEGVEIRRGTDHDVSSTENGDNLDFYYYFWEPRQDTLYNYIPSESKVVPRFTVPFSNAQKIPRHSFYELTHHYVAYIVTTEKETQTEYGISVESVEVRDIIVDKKTKRAYNYRIEDDMFFKGNSVSMWNFKDKKYIYNCSSFEFIEKAEKTLARNDISEEIRKKITDVLDGLDENDNNIILWEK